MSLVLWGFRLAAGLYCLLLTGAAWRLGQLRKRRQNWSNPRHKPNVTILAAVRNEAENLPAFLDSLAAQDYPPECIACILADDHSTDSSAEIIRAFQTRHTGIRMELVSLPAGMSGKKQALEAASERANPGLWLFTDADVQLPPGWVRGMAGYAENSGASMVCGPVQIDGGASAAAAWEATEFASLVATGAASLSFSIPSLCNGASYLVRPEALTEARTLRRDRLWPGGDDVFLLHALKNAGHTVVFACHPGLAVTHRPAGNLPAFLAQRTRWAGKWRSGLAGSNAGLARTIWLFHLLYLAGIGLLAAGHRWNELLWILLIRAVSETLFLEPFLWKPGFRNHAGRIWLMQIPYSLYVVAAGIRLAAGKPGFSWKGRNF